RGARDRRDRPRSRRPRRRDVRRRRGRRRPGPRPRGPPGDHGGGGSCPPGGRAGTAMSTTEPDTSSFGPSALATPANAITVVRILLAPVAFGLIVTEPVSWLTWAVWFGLTSSDGLDGYLARKH